MTDLIKRDAALAAIDTALNNATGDLFDCHAAIRALPAIDPAAIREAALQDRIEELVKELNVSNELGKALEEDAGQLRDKLAKAVEALNMVDLSIMENTNETEWRLWGESAVSGIRTTLAELEGK